MIKLKKDWIMAYNGQPTFCGILSKHFDEIAEKYGWKPSTQKQYIGDYERHILPRLTGRPLEEYDSEDFEAVVADINSNGEFKKSTLLGYWRLIKRVIEAAVDYEGMRNPLWGRKRKEILNPKDVTATEDLAIPRSMPLIMQLRLSEKIKQGAVTRGEMRGLMICMEMGTRLKEAAAVSVEDHRFPFPNLNCSELALHNSTDGQGTSRRGKLKTPNSYRIGILGPDASKIMNNRVAEIQDMISSGKIILNSNSNMPSIQQIPLVNKGENPLLPCSSPMLTKAFKRLLQDVGYNENDIVAAERLVESEEFQKAVTQVTPAEMGFTDEKDMTTYICRHQFYTNMYIVGMGELARQYAMGHRFENPTIDRRDFRNPDRSRRQAEEILRIPTINKAALDPCVIKINGDSLNYEDARDETIKVAVKKGRLEIRINSNEAMTPAEVRIKKIPGVDLHVSARQKESSIPYKKTANILNPYYREAREAYAMLEVEKSKKMENLPNGGKQE